MMSTVEPLSSATPLLTPWWMFAATIGAVWQFYCSIGWGSACCHPSEAPW